MTEAEFDELLKKGNCKVVGGGFHRGKKCVIVSNKKIKRPPPDYSVFFMGLKILADDLKIEEPVEEYYFNKPRKQRFDFCFVKSKLAIEIEGAVWVQGGHTRGSGFIKDMKKYNQAAILGFHLLRFTPDETENGAALGVIERFFKERA